jgi:hypothetical protein
MDSFCCNANKSRTLKASYTGDMHGRWDDCRVRIFKDITETKLRILTVQVGAEESIDQQTIDISSAELVPEVCGTTDSGSRVEL